MISENKVLSLASLFDERKKSVFTFNGYRIVVEESVGEYDYEIYEEAFDTKDNWQVVHWDTGFASEEEARKEAVKYLDNWEPSDDYYAQ